MRRMSRALVCGVCLLGVALASPAWAAGGRPTPVSPGSPEAFMPVGSSCPTFSWGAVDDATGYELVVYASPESAAGFLVEARDEPVIRVRIPGRALSWTPPAGSCLALSGSYAWSVRAVGRDGDGEWSGASLFRVEPVVGIGEMAAVLERALSRYLESRGLVLEGEGELAALISEELTGTAFASVTTPAAPPVQHYYQGGRRLSGERPAPRGVLIEDVELWLEESGSGMSDAVQLVFATPEFDGVPRMTEGDAWSIIVQAEDSASDDDGTMHFSTPGFSDALQLFTDGSAIVPELRYLKLRKLSSPPFTCASGSPEAGFYWDSDLKELCDCNGSGWAQVDGGGGCS